MYIYMTSSRMISIFMMKLHLIIKSDSEFQQLHDYPRLCSLEREIALRIVGVSGLRFLLLDRGGAGLPWRGVGGIFVLWDLVRCFCRFERVLGFSFCFSSVRPSYASKLY